MIILNDLEKYKIVDSNSLCNIVKDINNYFKNGDYVVDYQLHKRFYRLHELYGMPIYRYKAYIEGRLS